MSPDDQTDDVAVVTDATPVIEHETIDRTFFISELEPLMVQPPYRLYEIEFEHLKGKDSLSQWFSTLFWRFFFGYLILVGAKAGHWLYTHNGETKPLSAIISWELIALGASLGLALFACLIAYGLKKCKPTKKIKVMNKIEQHFKDNPGVDVIGRRP